MTRGTKDKVVAKKKEITLFFPSFLILDACSTIRFSRTTMRATQVAARATTDTSSGLNSLDEEEDDDIAINSHARRRSAANRHNYMAEEKPQICQI